MKKKTKKAVYIDTYSYGTAHEMFNVTLILMCSKIFDEVDCIIGRSAYENNLKIIKTQLPSNVKYQKIWVVNGNNRFSLLIRYLISAIQNIKFLFFSPKDRIIIFPFNNLFNLRIINFINKFYRRKILIFCHGELEGLSSDAIKGGFLHKILIKLCRNFFLNKNVNISENIYFSVLGDVLKNNIGNIIEKRKSQKFISIDHAYFFQKNNDLLKNNEILNIGTIGTISKTKGLYDFLKFSKRINAEYKEKIKISIIGTTHEDISLFKSAGIDLSSKYNFPLSRENFNQKLKELDYILFFYSKNNYRITASGAIMDAINYEKPILALKNDYFEYIFEKYGSIGFLFDNIEEMINKTEKILIDKVNINIDFENIKKSFSPEKISDQLFKELSNIGYL